MYRSIEGRPSKLQRADLLFRMWDWIAPSRDIDRAHTKREFLNNMADMNDLVLPQEMQKQEQTETTQDSFKHHDGLPD